jgi:hypothetical protein
VRGSGFNGTAMEGSPPASVYSEIEKFVIDETGDPVDYTEEGGVWNGTASGDDSAVVSGDRAVAYVDSDYDLSVNYESQEGQASATLQSDTGPDA